MTADNWHIIGHEWAVNLLKQHVTHKTHRQAYLITGPESVGRRTLALRFAQVVNCLKSNIDGEPCLECLTCGQIERMVHPDLTIVEAERAGGQIKVDQIRDLQHGLSLAPYDGNYRIALILRFEEANQQASNALLKTLEEPPRNVILLLTAESAERLLPTIVSRCEVIRLRPVPSAVLNEGLQSNWLVQPDEADLLTHLSGGRPGYSFRLYQNPELLSQRKSWLEDLINLLPAGRVARFEYADDMTKGRSYIPTILKTWLAFWRDVMLRSINSESQITNIDYQESIDQLSQDLDQVRIYQVVVAIEKVFTHLDHNVNPRLAIEDFMLVLPFGGN